MTFYPSLFFLNHFNILIYDFNVLSPIKYTRSKSVVGTLVLNVHTIKKTCTRYVKKTGVSLRNDLTQEIE